IFTSRVVVSQEFLVQLDQTLRLMINGARDDLLGVLVHNHSAGKFDAGSVFRGHKKDPTEWPLGFVYLGDRDSSAIEARSESSKNQLFSLSFAQHVSAPDSNGLSDLISPST